MEIISNEIQSVASGANVLFNETPVKGNCSIIHMDGSGLTTLRGLTKCQCKARFKVSFNGNIAIPVGGATQQISLSIAINGEPVGATFMAVTPPGANQYFNVSAGVYIDVPAGCCTSVSVENTSAIAIDVANANLIVERVA